MAKLATLLTAAAAAVSLHWGLGFPTSGEPPVIDVPEEHINQFDAYHIGDKNEKTIYLTFDCGYEAGYTESMLDVLKEKNVPAMFFLVGHYIESEPELTKRMDSEGHIIGNHTYKHPDMSQVSCPDAFGKELADLDESLNSLIGKPAAKYYRPPSGIYNDQNLEMAQKLGYKTLFWSLAYADWDRDNQPDPDASLEKLISRIHPGAIILLHNTSKTNEVILGRLIDKYREMGYTFGSLDELFPIEEQAPNA